MNRAPMFRAFLLALAWPTLAVIALADENWPCWRGPRGDGTSAESNVVVEWDVPAGKNVVWKTELPGSGHAQPIVWGDRIFIAACDESSKERLLVCLNRETGDVLWRRAVIKAPLETKHALNSYASSTPATDGKLVFVTFLEVDGRLIPAPNVGEPREITPGRMVVAAYDFDGNQKWLVRPGEFISAHGFCSSPVLFENLVIVNGDHDGDSYIVALDRDSGKTVWKQERQHKIRSYVTPIIREAAGRTQMMFSGSKHVISLDPRDGSPIWRLQGPTEQFVASPVFDGERLFIVGGYPDYHVMAIRVDGEGDVTDTHIDWHEITARCYVPSPVLVDKYLLVADDRGTGNCFDSATGKRHWQARLGTHFSTSLITAGGLAYFVADDGRTKVVRPGPELEIVADNPLGEACYSSPAISGGQIFLRGEKHLFCLGKRER